MANAKQSESVEQDVALSINLEDPGIDEVEFDQWDSNWYWDNGFAGLSVSDSAIDEDDVEIIQVPDSPTTFDCRRPLPFDCCCDSAIFDDDLIGCSTSSSSLPFVTYYDEFDKDVSGTVNVDPTSNITHVRIRPEVVNNSESRPPPLFVEIPAAAVDISVENISPVDQRRRNSAGSDPDVSTETGDHGGDDDDDAFGQLASMSSESSSVETLTLSDATDVEDELETANTEAFGSPQAAATSQTRPSSRGDYQSHHQQQLENDDAENDDVVETSQKTLSTNFRRTSTAVASTSLGRHQPPVFVFAADDVANGTTSSGAVSDRDKQPSISTRILTVWSLSEHVYDSLILLTWQFFDRIVRHRPQMPACLVCLCIGLCLGFIAGGVILLRDTRGCIGAENVGYRRLRHVGQQFEYVHAACSTSTSKAASIERAVDGLWRDQLEEVMAENARLRQKMSEFENEVVDLLQRAHGSLSELSAKLISLNGFKTDTRKTSTLENDDDHEEWYL